MFQSVLTKIVGKKSERELKRLQSLVSAVGGLEDGLQGLDDGALRGRLGFLRGRADNGEPLDDLMAETFAVTREAARRTC